MNIYSICEYCKVKILTKKLKLHYEKCPRISKKIVNCIYCNSRFQEYNIEKHIRICSKNLENLVEKIQQKTIEILDEKEYIRCQFCNDSFFRKDLENHKSICTKIPKELIQPKIFVTCEYCNSKIEKNKIKIHFLLKHKFKEIKYTDHIESVKSYNGKNIYRTDNNGIVQFLGQNNKSFKVKKIKTIKNVDSNYNFNSEDNTSFNGRFGSMPLHDNYDDESNAE